MFNELVCVIGLHNACIVLGIDHNVLNKITLKV